MIVGIETTAHTFGVGIVDKGKILANVKDAYTTESGGIIPMDAAAHHHDCADRIWNEALGVAGVFEKDVDAIAVSSSPGFRWHRFLCTCRRRNNLGSPGPV